MSKNHDPLTRMNHSFDDPSADHISADKEDNSKVEAQTPKKREREREREREQQKEDAQLLRKQSSKRNHDKKAVEPPDSKKELLSRLAADELAIRKNWQRNQIQEKEEELRRTKWMQEEDKELRKELEKGNKDRNRKRSNTKRKSPSSSDDAEEVEQIQPRQRGMSVYSVTIEDIDDIKQNQDSETPAAKTQDPQHLSPDFHNVKISVTEESAFHESIWGQAKEDTDQNAIPARLRPFIDRPTTEDEATTMLTYSPPGHCIIRTAGVVVEKNKNNLSRRTSLASRSSSRMGSHSSKADGDDDTKDFALSVKQTDGIVWHCNIDKITRKGKDLYVLGNDLVPPPIFGSLQDLLVYFTAHPYHLEYTLVKDGVLQQEALRHLNVNDTADPGISVFRAKSDSMQRMREHRGSAEARLQGHRRPSIPMSVQEEMQDADAPKPCHSCFCTTPAIAAMFVSAYVLVGMLFYTQYMGWSASFTFYFIIVIITTVGYGDHEKITSDGPLFFTTLYVFSGVSLVVASLNLVVTGIVIKQKKIKRAYRRKMVAKMLNMAPDDADGNTDGVDVSRLSFDSDGLPRDRRPSDTSTISVSSLATPVTVVHLSKVDRVARWFRLHPITQATGFLLLMMPIGLIFGTQSKEGWNFVESLYYIIVTGTTVGFGDFHPESEAGQWFMAFYMIPLVLVVGNLINEISRRLILGYSDSFKIQPQDVFEDLTQSLISTVLNDDQVTKDEWLTAMLVACGVVDAEFCDMCIAYFDRQDSDGDGLLTRKELERAIDKNPLSEKDQEKALETIKFMDGLSAHVTKRLEVKNSRAGYQSKFQHLRI